MPATAQRPTTCVLECQAEIDLQADAGGKRRPSFSALAYTGGKMKPRGWGNDDVVIDLRGLTARPSPPALRDHDRTKIVGQATNVAIGGKRVEVSGIITGDIEDRKSPAGEVVLHARNGFKWPVSVGVAIQKMEYIGERTSVTVNGSKVEGPVYVVRAAEMYEVSFLSVGADKNAGADVAAAANMEMIKMADEPSTATVETPAEIKAERERVKQINDLAADHAELRAQAIDNGWSTERTAVAVLNAERDARQLNKLRDGRPSVNPVMSGDGVANRDVLACATMLLCGASENAEKAFGEETCTRAADLGIGNADDLCRAALRAAHVDVPRDRTALIEAGFSTNALAGVLQTAAERSVLSSYEGVPNTWAGFTLPRTVKNFREHDMLRPYMLSASLQPVAPSGELKHATLDGETYAHKAGTFGKIVFVTREMLINDDIGVWLEIQQQQARQAARLEGDLVYTLLLANAGDFFAAGNSNYLSGGDSALSASALQSAITLLRKRTDDDGKPINLRPAVLVVGPELEFTARALLDSITLERSQAAGDMEPQGNPLKSIVKLEVEARLSNTKFHANASDSKWFLFANPNDAATVVLSYLNGRRTPLVQMVQPPPDVLGVGSRVIFDVGADTADNRGGVMSAGE